MTIVRGDQHPIAFTITDSSGTAIPAARITGITAKLGGLNKNPTWDIATQRWSFPITEAETMAMSIGDYELKLRIIFASTDIRNVSGGTIRVRD